LRCCRFSGFQEFKIRLAQGLAFGTSATHSVILDTDTLGGVANKIFEYTLTSLDWARQRLNKDDLERAVDALARATSIEFFGFGRPGSSRTTGSRNFRSLVCLAALNPTRISKSWQRR
jgi:DNA-binding MurR/RpiR family transcriptional regulator